MAGNLQPLRSMFDHSPQAQALRDLRTARRRRYAERIDWIEALYRIYVSVLFGAFGFTYLAGLLNDPTVTDRVVEDLAQHGPSLLGALVAVAVAAGLQMGGHGGPLAIEAPDVQHVLLAPIDRGKVLRRVALRELRTPVLIGLIVGLIVGNFAFQRLPGPAGEWFFFLGVFGAVVPLLVLASAMLASGRRLRPAVINFLGTLVIGWSLFDFLLDTRTSPATMLGELALWPLHEPGHSIMMPVLGLVTAVILLILGLKWLGGTSLEASRCRADLATQLRAAVTFKNLRVVVLLRRQLASEMPRRQPWFRLTSNSGQRPAVWIRDWQSLLRWPAARVARVCLLGIVAGLALCAAWAGTTPLAALAALTLLVAALDAVEPLAQEIDYPTRRDLLPIDAATLIRRHLWAPTVLMIGVTLIAAITALLVSDSASLVLELSSVMLLPTALLTLCCAALSATNDPYAYLFNPGWSYFDALLPAGLAILGIGGPLLFARVAAENGYSAISAAALSELVVLAGCAVVTLMLEQRVEDQAPVTA